MSQIYLFTLHHRMSQSFSWCILRSFLILNLVSSSCFMQLNPMNPFQSKYSAGQANIGPPPSNNEKSSQQTYQPSAQLSQPVQSHVKNDFGDPKSGQNEKNLELQRMVQQLYMAQAQVQLEATEIRRAQSVASEAQKRLEEASNNVRVITTALRSAQETIATTAQHAQTAQLQLAAHDQLLFTARQKVDALSAQLVGLQAEVGISGDTANINLPALLDKLKEPLHPDDQPKPPPSLLNSVGSSAYTDNGSRSVKQYSPNWNDYKQYSFDQPKNVEKGFKNPATKLKRSNFDDQLDRLSNDYNPSEKIKSLLDWIHEENRKDLSIR
ncbi:uncharacterized protein LOC119078084 [Bradysia coprophila]|uniref:uncharacterized protein LOC119078084 n=1 Tax=Bradysia coprophila TaxID=38358 RepID=UPI00187DC1A3|nr:uncharacterized protein LOC119078084 [Bradysia coprophila]